MTLRLHRIIDPGRRPLGVTGGAERDVARYKADRADAGRRLLLLCSRRLGDDESEKREDQPEAHGKLVRLPL